MTNLKKKNANNNIIKYLNLKKELFMKILFIPIKNKEYWTSFKKDKLILYKFIILTKFANTVHTI